MSEGPPEPPPIPEGHEPPPIPQQRERPPTPERHEPPPILELKQMRAVGDTSRGSVADPVLGNTRPPPIPPKHGPPPVPKSHGPPDILKVQERRVTFVVDRQTRMRQTSMGEAALGRQSSPFGLATFLCWLGLLLTVACIPIALMGALWPGLRSPFWLTVLTLAFVAICLEKFIKNKPQVSSDLRKLSLRLAYGFFFISLVGLAAAAMRAGVYISHVINTAILAVHRMAVSWHESNGIIAWCLHKADAVMQFAANHAHNTPAASPSPFPTATPSP